MALTDQIGTFAWFSLMTHDTDKATAFYCDLLQWSTTEYDIPGHGKSLIYVASGLNFGNPVSLDADDTNPSHWIPYIAVSDTDKSIEQAISLGGSERVPAFDIPTIGRTAVISDPVGTPFHLFTPANLEDDLKMTGKASGQICWVELIVDGPDEVIPFYQTLLGWTVSEPQPMNGGEYYGLDICGDKLGGIMKRPPGVAQMPPIWIPYMTVVNIEESTSRVTELGGQVHIANMNIPDTGIFSMCQDPTGASFYLFESTMDN